MELNVFIKELERSLVRRGIHPEVANRHAQTLQRTFTDDDLREIAQIRSADEVEGIAESIALLLTKNKIKTRTAPDSAKTEQHTPKVTEQPAPPKPEETEPAPKPKSPPPAREFKPADEVTWLRDEEDEDFFAVANGSDKTTKGFYTFWGIFVLTLPITLILAAAFFGLFIGAFALLTALIVGLIAGVVVMVAAGAAVSLVGVIFGVTQLFSFPAAGVYEIGIGIMAAGIVMFASILVYNIAVRFLPWVMGKVAVLLRFTCRKLRDLFLHLRRECYRL